MPYMGELADKTSHRDIIKNPDVEKFLSECTYIAELNDEMINEVKSKFQKVPKENIVLPRNIVSIDGSNYEASIRKEIPSTRVGYVKIGIVLLQRNDLKETETKKIRRPVQSGGATRK